MTDFKIIEPKPGVKLCVVKTPERATGYRIMTGGVVFTLHYTSTIIIDLIPKQNYTDIGIYPELTEEQCEELVWSFRPGLGVVHLYKNYVGHDGLLKTAKESFASLMHSIGCYSENPYTHPSKLSPIGYNKKKAKWKEAQSKLAKYLILKIVE